MGRQPGPGHRRALPLRAVALVAAVFLREQNLAAGGIRRERRGLADHQAGGNCRQPHAYTKTTHDRSLQRGCVTTSIIAGSPALTTSTAFFSSGPRSFRSLTGPGVHPPMDSASLA